MREMSNKALQNMFKRLNRAYFGKRLNCKVIFTNLLRKEDCIGICYNPDEIQLDKSLKKVPCVAEMTLLHEMVHAEQWFRNVKHHGRAFQKRIQQLYNQGAYDGLL